MTNQSENAYPAGVSSLLPSIQEQLAGLEKNHFGERFKQRDATLWSDNPTEQDEIAQRLGWLDAASQGGQLVDQAEELLKEVLSEGFTHAVVLGMGGSSLAPEVYSRFIASHGEEKKGYLVLSILDSTSPEQITHLQQKIPLEKTLFIVSSKSGTTVEVKTLFAYFWKLVKKVDPENTGSHFIAISDPGTQLQKLASERGFRKSFEADANAGGRYSALIAFGLVPAVLAGYDGKKLLASSLKLSHARGGGSLALDDPGVQLGVVLGAAYQIGRDKLTILADAQVESMGSWIEQLVAESSGKMGKGIIPVDLEPTLPINSYGNDRLFVYLRFDGKLDTRVAELADQPVFICNMPDLYDLAAEFYRWEVAVAVACIILGVNAFNQPNVQESKDIATQMLNVLKEGKDLGIDAPVWQNEVLALYSHLFTDQSHTAVQSYLADFVRLGKEGDFVAINAFIERSEENELKLEAFRKYLTQATQLPTTLGFGPRFLHSSGQLHKGGKNNGLFIVISQDELQAVDVPGEGITFNNLIFAQALGDSQALESHNRRVIRLQFSANSFKKANLSELFRL